MTTFGCCLGFVVSYELATLVGKEAVPEDLMRLTGKVNTLVAEAPRFALHPHVQGFSQSKEAISFHQMKFGKKITLIPSFFILKFLQAV